MLDTIDMLEAIGSDAFLRHASPDDLVEALKKVQASEALTAAVISSDGSKLSDDVGLWPWPTLPPQGTMGLYDGSFSEDG